MPKYAVDLARKLRRRQTPTEGLLWKNLRGRKFQGLKFLRQHPIVYGEVYKSFFFIADFHSLTTIKDAQERIHNVRSVAAAWLACGFDVEKNYCIYKILR